ncbi:MAG: hypothetical protein ABSC16_13730, partial [Candidatus Dormibacteria bacterium]
RWSDSPKRVIGFNRNTWSDSAETGGRIQPKRVIAFTRNPHPAFLRIERRAPLPSRTERLEWDGAAAWKTAAPWGSRAARGYLARKAEADYEVRCLANELVIA